MCSWTGFCSALCSSGDQTIFPARAAKAPIAGREVSETPLKTAAEMIGEVAAWLRGAEEKEKRLFFVLMLETLTPTPPIPGFERVIINTRRLMAQIREKNRINASSEEGKKRAAIRRANAVNGWKKRREQQQAAERQKQK